MGAWAAPFPRPVAAVGRPAPSHQQPGTAAAQHLASVMGTGSTPPRTGWSDHAKCRRPGDHLHWGHGRLMILSTAWDLLFFCSAAFYLSCQGNEGFALPRGTSVLCESKQAHLPPQLPSAAAPRCAVSPEHQETVSQSGQFPSREKRRDGKEERRSSGSWCAQSPQPGGSCLETITGLLRFPR